MKGECLVEGCTKLTAGYICHEHFFTIKLEMRQRFWRDTNYSTKEPSEEMKKAINDAITDNSRSAPVG